MACWFFSGAMVAFLWALSGLIRHGRKAALSAWVVFACGVWLLAGFRVSLWPTPAGSWIALVPIPAIYSIGPVFYFWFRREVMPAPVRVWFHLLWPTLAVLGIVILHARASQHPLAENLQFALFVGTKLLPFLYILYAIYCMQWVLEAERRSRYRGLIWLCIALMAALVIGLIGVWPGMQAWTFVSAMLLTPLMFLSFLFGISNPHLIHSLQLDYQKTKYEKTRLGSVDVDERLERLHRLMAEDKPYLDEDYDLSQLASDLELNVHQVSEILNARLGSSFPEFVNRYRVQESLILLRNEPDRSVLSIALAVGFNSRSSFHRSFKKVMQTTPRDYRNSSIV
ncbi:MAG: helix-turn-helix domain-containing protein [Leptospiraceae bacterium]|nr:helix-turn-helix domain-containing protein [Leptospiraceae bacterium]MCB1303105.1 helix-turn-helix domain-containing protein [Leptospiraceae bacterium]